MLADELGLDLGSELYELQELVLRQDPVLTWKPPRQAGGSHQPRHRRPLRLLIRYSERPGVMGTVVRTRQLFGRVASGHLAADIRRTDGLLD
jgi:hypothetical protein